MSTSKQQGKLVMIATPIGNLGDITLRALDALRDADVVLAEDTRVTSKLLHAYDISTPCQRCDENVIRARAQGVVERILAGETVAFVSDAGTPAVSDPGAVLVAAAREAGCNVEVLPGASAVLTALVGSGFSSTAFYFGGFLPRKAGACRNTLENLQPLDAVLIFYESPHRVAATLEIVAQVFPSRDVVLARELTKLHEEVLCLGAAELAANVAARDAIKGEVVLLVGPPSAQEATQQAASSEELLAFAQTLEGSRSQKAKELAAHFDISRNEAYELLG